MAIPTADGRAEWIRPDRRTGTPANVDRGRTVDNLNVVRNRKRSAYNRMACQITPWNMGGFFYLDDERVAAYIWMV